MNRFPLPVPMLILCIAIPLALPACKRSASGDQVTAGSPATPATDPATAPEKGSAPRPDAGAAVKQAAATAAPADATTNPREEAIAALRKFAQMRSYHADMHVVWPNGEAARKVDFVAPDRMRLDMGDAGIQTVVGDAMYMTVRGHSKKIPLPAGTLAQWRDPGNLEAGDAGISVEAQGVADLDGIAARKYSVRYTAPRPIELTLWVGSGGLPLQMQVTGGETAQFRTTTTIRYTRHDDPTIRIDAPK